MSRIETAFRRAKDEGRAAFIPYLTAGFPDEQTFLEQARALLEVADVLEHRVECHAPVGPTM